MGIHLEAYSSEENPEADGSEENSEASLTQLIQGAFAKTDPRVITMVNPGLSGKEGGGVKFMPKFPMSNGAFRDGYYTNTTRQESD